MIRKILVAIDGSEHASRALDLALEIAEKFSTEVVLLSVVDYMPIIDEEYINRMKKRHREIITEAIKKVKNVKPHLKATEKLVEGRPADKIIETAKEGEFDMIFMGSRGQGGIKEFYLGSVSDRVADGAPCPVVIVK